MYAIRVLTFFQSLRFMKAPLRVERESLSLRISTSLQARFAIQRENNYKKTGSSKAAGLTSIFLVLSALFGLISYYHRLTL